MEKIFESTYHNEEERHWWLRARRNAILSHVVRVPHNVSIVDVGCAGGSLIKDLRKKGYTDVRGIDTSKDAVMYCASHGITEVELGDARALPFPDQSMDVVIASDTLEHIEDDGKALREWQRVLKPHGLAIVYVPAFSFLWSTHDQTNLHYRRYTKYILTERLRTAGFTIQDASYWNMTLFIPLYCLRIIQNIVQKLKKNNSVSHTESVRSYPLLNTLLYILLRSENFLLAHGIHFPFGISVYALATK